MNKVISRIIKFAIKKAKRNKYIQNIFESPFDISKFQDMGEFQDSYNNTFQLKDGLRTYIRPMWKKNLKTKATEINTTYLSNQRNNGIIYANKLKEILRSLGVDLAGKDIAEIGCHSGATSYALGELGAKSVVGTEFTGYKVASNEFEEDINSEKFEEINIDLANIRKALQNEFKNTNSVKFINDDICNSNLEENKYDIICSWEVMEHINKPDLAFKNIYRSLKPGGIMFHEYNPFFCYNGGHSLCTLDFMWGHTRLNENDFLRYLKQYRPSEVKRAFSFYKNGLNRMTISDLKSNLGSSGLETISVLPFTKEQHLRMIDEETLAQSQNIYNNLSIEDLCTPRIYVIAKKV